MRLLRTLRYITNHPLNREHRPQALMRYLRWQVGSRVLHAPVAMPFVNDARLLVRAGMAGATGNVYCKLHEYEDMAFVLHYLRAEDRFFDIGANIGSYSVLAAAVLGAQGVAVEPIPAAYAALLDNLRLNGVANRVEPLNVGVGAEEGTLRFSTQHDTTNHVIAAGDEDRHSLDVPVRTIDQLSESGEPSFIKIDVEGFELPVVQGAAQTLRRPSLKGLLIELNGNGPRYGYDEDEVHRILIGHGLRPYAYHPLSRTLVSVESRNTRGNTLYLRDPKEASDRVASAPRFALPEGTI